MKKGFLALLAAGLLALANSAQAALIDRGNGLIYDDVLDITWLQDANYAQTSGYDADGLLNWDDGVAWADQLEYQGFGDWRLASMSVAAGLPTGTADQVVDCRNATEAECRDNELGYMFYYNLDGSPADTLVGDQTSIDGVDLYNIQLNYFSGTEIPAVDSAFFFQFFGGIQGGNVKPIANGAWAVRDGDVLPPAIPVPATLFLVALGLCGIGAHRKLRAL